MYNVAVASVAPVGEVSKRKNDWMGVIWIVLLVLEHVLIYIATAANSTAARLETDPVFALVFTFVARIKDRRSLKGFFRGDVLWSTMWTVLFRSDCVKALEIH